MRAGPARKVARPGTSLVVLTGAGISADSGLATFRDAVATPEAWARDPAGVWRFYQARRGQLRSVQPNAGHRALVRLEEGLRARGAEFLLVTQNVDDLHERAGSKPLHMHGELRVLRCEACGATGTDDEHVDPEQFVSCAGCGHARLRPDVVWFGEMPYHMERIEEALGACTVFLSVGTSGVVHPAAGFLHAARSGGARTIVNSLDAPDNLGRSDRFFPGRAEAVLPELVEGLLGELSGDLT